MIEVPSSFVSLEEALHNIISICRILVNVLHDEQDILMNKRNGDWNGILSCKEKALKNLSHAEDECRSIFMELATSMGLKVEDYSLTHFLENIKEDESGKLREIQKELFESLHDICVLNRQNASLLRHALYYNQSFLAIIRGFVDRTKSLIYGPEGRVAPSPIQLVGKRI